MHETRRCIKFLGSPHSFPFLKPQDQKLQARVFTFTLPSHSHSPWSSTPSSPSLPPWVNKNASFLHIQLLVLSLLTESELSIISLFSDSNHGHFALTRLKALKVSHLLMGLWVALDFSALLPYMRICLQLILCFGYGFV